jgi:hypothetical protein
MFMTAGLFLGFHPKVSYPTKSAVPASSPLDGLRGADTRTASINKLGGMRKLKEVGDELQNQTYRKYFSKNISVHMVTTLDGAAKVCEALKKSKLIGLDCEGVNLSRHILADPLLAEPI